ncbi:hypothetical protein NWO25_16260 [Enterococcus lactis]|nr:hypothetical protein [Enterococcus lactis]
MAAYHELVEERLFLPCKQKLKFVQRKHQTILTSLEQTIEELNQKWRMSHVVRFVKISDLKKSTKIIL